MLSCKQLLICQHDLACSGFLCRYLLPAYMQKRLLLRVVVCWEYLQARARTRDCCRAPRCLHLARILVQVEVAWEPEPIFESSGGLTAREVDAIQDRLAVICTWIKYMGLGDLEERHVFLVCFPCA